MIHSVHICLLCNLCFVLSFTEYAWHAHHDDDPCLTLVRHAQFPLHIL